MPVTDHAVVSDGAVWLADGRGDVDTTQEPAAGLYVGDCRLVSGWELSVVGHPLAVASGHAEAARRVVVQMPPSDRNDPPPVLLVREQAVGGAGLTERVRVMTPRREPVRLTVRLAFSVDFADQFRVRSDGRVFDLSGALVSTSPRPDGADCCYVHELAGRRFSAASQLRLDPPPHAVPADDDGLVFEWHLELGPGEGAEITATVTDGSGSPTDGAGSGRSAGGAGTGAGSRPSLDRTRARSLADLDALMIRSPVDPAWRVPAAGAPWFVTLFGRDSLLTAELASGHRPGLAADVLRSLAALQGRVDDPDTLEQPGRIVHEVRRSELATLGQVPYGRYYGSVDATPLFLVSLGRQVMERGDGGLARELEAAARAAASWVLGPGGLEEHGFLVYRPDETGLANHGWKDSHDATPFADGSLASGPVALVEVQGYAWEALWRTAGLARGFWDDPAYAEQLETAAEELRGRLRDAFWLDDGFPALALDGRGRKVDVLASNAGHLLWSGVLDEDEARSVAERLMSEAFFTGWGLRTLAAGQTPYSAMSYHNGSVWPHDTALVMSGMAAYGMLPWAKELARAVVDSAEAFQGRMPELFAGWSRSDVPVPVPYPHAGRPQAWAAAAGLAAARILEAV